MTEQCREQSIRTFDERLWERVQHLARRMLRRFPKVRRWDDTDDVTNIAAIKVWKTLEAVDFESEAHYERVLAKNIRWVLLDLARRHGATNSLGANHETWHGEVESEVPCQTMELQRWTEFHEAVEDLSADTKEVFDLLWYAGLSKQSAADTLGISDKTLRNRWRTARIELAKRLGRNSSDELVMPPSMT